MLQKHIIDNGPLVIFERMGRGDKMKRMQSDRSGSSKWITIGIVVVIIVVVAAIVIAYPSWFGGGSGGTGYP